MVQKIIKAVFAFLVISVILFVGYRVMNTPEQRTTGEKMGDAIDAVSDGVDKAGRQLKDRTPGEKIEDAVKDVGDDIKDNRAP